MSVVLSGIEKVYLQGFPGRTWCNLRLNRFLILASFFYDIPEGKGTSEIQHGTSVQRPCIRCIGTVEDFQSTRCEKARSIQDTLAVRNCGSKVAQASGFCREENVYNHTFLEKKRANNPLKNFSPIKKACVSEESQLAPTFVLDNIYNVFGFETLHDLHMCTAELLKECTFKMLGSDRVKSKPGGIVEQGQVLDQMRSTILCCVNFLLAAIDWYDGSPGVHVDVSSKLCSVQLNCLFLNCSVRELPERNHF